MVELGETTDPTMLIPGDVAGLKSLANQFQTRAESCAQIAGQIQSACHIDGWEGAAAEAFRSQIATLPKQWVKATQAWTEAGMAIARYANVLEVAQGQAITAIRRWDDAQETTARVKALAAKGTVSITYDPGADDRELAQAILTRARADVAEAGMTCCTMLDNLTAQAPTHRQVRPLSVGYGPSGQTILYVAPLFDSYHSSSSHDRGPLSWLGHKVLRGLEPEDEDGQTFKRIGKNGADDPMEAALNLVGIGLMGGGIAHTGGVLILDENNVGNSVDVSPAAMKMNESPAGAGFTTTMNDINQQAQNILHSIGNDGDASGTGPIFNDGPIK